MTNTTNFTELSDTANPKTILFWRKTKTGDWEKIESRWYRQGYKNENIPSICGLMAADEICRRTGGSMSGLKCCVAYKATTLKGNQIYSSLYWEFLWNIEKLSYICHDKETGIIIDKTKFVPYNRIMQWVKQMSKEHSGIKNWKQAKPCKIDNYLIWGKLIFNDGFMVKVAFIGIHGK